MMHFELEARAYSLMDEPGLVKVEVRVRTQEKDFGFGKMLGAEEMMFESIYDRVIKGLLEEMKQYFVEGYIERDKSKRD